MRRTSGCAAKRYASEVEHLRCWAAISGIRLPLNLGCEDAQNKWLRGQALRE
jgi:hypothetical protein